jgi:hypothetical protein
MNILTKTQHFLAWSKVINHEGKDKNGRYITTGINRKNPLSYIVLFIFGIFLGSVAFYREFIDFWKHSW